MEGEHSTAGEADSPAKSGPISSAELLQVQNLIQNGVANIR
jgi:hypothetical protein